MKESLKIKKNIPKKLSRTCTITTGFLSAGAKKMMQCTWETVKKNQKRQ